MRVVWFAIIKNIDKELMMLRRGAIIVVSSTMILIDSYSGQAADRQTLTASAPSEELSAVPSTIAPVSEAVARQLSQLHTSFCDGEARGDFDFAIQNLATERSLAHQHFDERHYIVRRINADSVWHNWNMSLSEEQRAACRTAGNMLKDAVVTEESRDYLSATKVFRKAIKVFVDLNAPPTADFAVIQIHFSNALCFAGERREAIEQAERALKTAISSDGQFSPVVASALREQAAVLGNVGEYSLSLRKACRAIQIWAAFDPNFAANESTANSYDTLVELCFTDFLMLKLHDRASYCLEELSKLRSQCKPVNNLKLCEVKEYEYSLLKAMNRNERALAKAQEWFDFANQFNLSDNPEVQDAEIAKCETYLKINETSKARDILKKLLNTQLQNRSSRAVEACPLTDICPLVLIADHRYSEALSMLEPRVNGTDENFWLTDMSFRSILTAYSTALREVGRGEQAKEVENRVASIEASLDKMRHQVDADSQIKFPWEK
jgi:tetratricopeptide (TPR) repeat protein